MHGARAPWWRVCGQASQDRTSRYAMEFPDTQRFRRRCRSNGMGQGNYPLRHQIAGTRIPDCRHKATEYRTDQFGQVSLSAPTKTAAQNTLGADGRSVRLRDEIHQQRCNQNAEERTVQGGTLFLGFEWTRRGYRRHGPAVCPYKNQHDYLALFGQTSRLPGTESPLDAPQIESCAHLIAWHQRLTTKSYQGP